MTKLVDIGAYDGGFETPQSPAFSEKHRLVREELDDAFNRYGRRVENELTAFSSAGPSTEWSLQSFDIGRPLGKGQHTYPY